ncbi:uncharacterized protein LOC131150952 isoform X2 [Malania oleifera]|uniref:uncharacterized protein LOC131150952 isoform X2 n=1 Tax=Malania oleifera TaxID=397392 RepID=UPI0025AE7BC5|nr:uncharacterized protein LOC131150952 isoform X2 [Malania oleifera]
MAKSGNPSRNHHHHQDPALGGNLSSWRTSSESRNSNQGSSIRRYFADEDTNWSAKEKAILKAGLHRYASESDIKGTLAIAGQLEGKTAREAALNLQLMIEEDTDPSTVTYQNPAKPNDAVTISPMGSDDEVSSIVIDHGTGDLILQNLEAFKKISENLAANQLEFNVVLFFQTWDNILKILKRMSNMPGMTKLGPVRELMNSTHSLTALFSIHDPSEFIEVHFP